MSPATASMRWSSAVKTASLPPIVNCDNASHATSRYFNESNQPFSPDEAPRSVQPDLAIGT
jgi:hypothetical protein